MLHPIAPASSPRLPLLLQRPTLTAADAKPARQVRPPRRRSSNDYFDINSPGTWAPCKAVNPTSRSICMRTGREDENFDDTTASGWLQGIARYGDLNSNTRSFSTRLRGNKIYNKPFHPARSSMQRSDRHLLVPHDFGSRHISRIGWERSRPYHQSGLGRRRGPRDNCITLISSFSPISATSPVYLTTPIGIPR